MAGTVNIREIVLGVLMEVTEGEAYSHIALRNTLEKYQYLPKYDRAFISRVTEGTLENLIQIDYVIECFSKVPIYNMKPLIRNLLRMSVYQLKYMDNVPDSAVVNEAVRLAQKRGFYNLKGFVNGVLRAAARGMDTITYPSAQTSPIEYLSVRYSMPQWILKKWMDQFSFEEVEKVCASFQEEEPLTVRLRTDRVSKEQIIESLESEGVTWEQHPYLDGSMCRMSVPCWSERWPRQTGEITVSMCVRLRAERARICRISSREAAMWKPGTRVKTRSP